MWYLWPQFFSKFTMLQNHSNVTFVTKFFYKEQFKDPYRWCLWKDKKSCWHLCNQKISLKQNLRRHSSEVHGGKKPLKCDNCDHYVWNYYMHFPFIIFTLFFRSFPVRTASSHHGCDQYWWLQGAPADRQEGPVWYLKSWRDPPELSVWRRDTISRNLWRGPTQIGGPDGPPTGCHRQKFQVSNLCWKHDWMSGTFWTHWIAETCVPSWFPD